MVNSSPGMKQVHRRLLAFAVVASVVLLLVAKKRIVNEKSRGMLIGEADAEVQSINDQTKICEFKQHSLQYRGGAFMNLAASSAQDCATKCIHDVRCDCYYYQSGWCWKKDSCTTETVSAPAGSETGMCHSKGVSCNQIKLGVQYRGGAYQHLASGSPQDCATKCSQDARCDCYVFQSGWCWKKQRCSAATVGAAAGSETGFCGVTQCFGSLLGYQYKGGAYAHAVSSSARECATKCAQDGRCDCYFFQGGTCWKKEKCTTGTVGGAAGSETGFCGESPCFNFKPNAQYKGPAYASVVASSARQCARNCDGDGRCDCFVYVPGSCWKKEDCSATTVSQGGGAQTGFCRAPITHAVPIPVPDIVKKFAPVLIFHRDRQKSYPMDAQVYFDGYCYPNSPKPSASCAEVTRVSFKNLVYQSTFDTRRMVTYYRIGTCMGVPSIEYHFYYGVQFPCFVDGISCKLGGYHPQDWEHVVVLLDAGKSRVDKVRFYQHQGYYTVDRSNFEEESTNHPKVYVGWASHGSYAKRNTKSMMGNEINCQYFGDAEIPSNKENKWHTWNSRMYDLRPHGRRVAQDWMIQSNKARCPGKPLPTYFDSAYGNMNTKENLCDKASACDDTGAGLLDPATARWGCKAATCEVIGPSRCPSGSHCCRSKSPQNPMRCERHQKDFLGIPHCPSECRGDWRKPWIKGNC